MDIDRRSAITPENFHAIISISIDGFLLVAMDGTILETNDSYCQLVGYSRDELLKLQIPAIDAVDNKEDVARRFELIIRNGSLRFETRHLHKDGTVIDVEVSANYSAAHGGSIFSFIRDITSQKRNRQIMDARLRLMEFSLTHSLDELLQQTLDEAEALTGSYIGFYHFMDPDSQMLTLHAWSTKTATMFCKAEGTGSHYPVSQAGVWVDCILEQRPVIHNDYGSLPHKKGMPDGHAPVIRELVVPIFRHDKIVAIMGIGNKATDYTQQDVEAISTLADLAWDVAERKKAEEELQQSEERYQTLIMGSNDGMILQERSGNILIWNKAAERIFGICAGDIVGQKSTDRSWKTYTEDGALLPGAEHPSMLTLTSGKPCLGKMLRVERDRGDYSWIAVNTNPIFTGSESSPSAVAITFTDITERKLAETSLVESEKRFRNIFELPLIGIAITSPDKGWLHVNDRLCEDLGYTREELQMLTWPEVTHPEDLRADLEQFNRVVSGQSDGYSMEKRFIRKNGLTMHAEISARCIRKAGGEIDYFVALVQNITNRKKAEERLHREQNMLARTESIAHVGSWEWEIATDTVTWSDEMFRIFKRNPAEGAPSYEEHPRIYHPDDMKELSRVAEIAQRDGTPYELELRAIRPNGDIRICLAQGLAERSADGKVTRLFGSLQDITERKEIEAALTKNERFLQTIIDTEPECIKLLDIDGNLLMMNRAGLAMIDADSFEQVQGQSVCPLITEPYRDAFIALTKQVFQGIPGTLEFETIGLKGRHVWLETHAIPFRNENGEIASLLGITRDVTERKKSVKDLQNSEAKFSAIFHASPDSININRLDDAVFVDVNEGFTAMLGYSAEDVIGKSSTAMGIWVNVEDRARLAHQLKELGWINNLEAHLRKKDGSLLIALVSSRLIELDGVLCTLNIARDITELRHAEQEKQKHEIQLLHTQKLESLGILAGGIAHDFNNILTSIVGNTELALMQLNPESPALDNLHRIEKSAARATDLARQMLAYSGKGKFVIEPIDINRLVQEMGHMLDVSISKKTLLQYNLAQKLPSIEVDATQIRQIAMNLVINASEAMGGNNGIVAISTGCMDCDDNYLKAVTHDKNIKAGRYIYLEVADNGCGMDKETLAKVFDPFFTTKFTGRGLGLAAVQGIVRGHKGFIEVCSEPGKGTTFKVFLPASDQVVESEINLIQKDDWMGQGKVLLVDDEEDVRDIGKAMLQMLGFTVITANDGNEAVELFKANSDIAFVILDLTMPLMDGEQCFYELLRIKSDAKVVMSSGFSEQEVTRKFMGKGLSGFIQKPYKMSAMKETIQKM